MQNRCGIAIYSIPFNIEMYVGIPAKIVQCAIGTTIIFLYIFYDFSF